MSGSCHTVAVTQQQAAAEEAPTCRKVAIIGMGNVGKSIFFNFLTGSYSFVSNYPHTTIVPNRQRLTLHQQPVEIIDTPGINSVVPPAKGMHVHQRACSNKEYRLNSAQFLHGDQGGIAGSPWLYRMAGQIVSIWHRLRPVN
ncbi:MAG: GTPase domain-containing protein [Magnetococcus sp. XQGC-1]